MFYWRSTIPAPGPAAAVIEVAFTSRAPYRSAGPFGGFNLGGHVGDDPVAVEHHRRVLAQSFGVPRDRLLFMPQVHGTTVVEVSGPWAGRRVGPTPGQVDSSPAGNTHLDLPPCDGIFTRATDLALAVLVADCVPVLLFDATAGVVAAVHAGRPGMIDGIIPRTVQELHAVGATDIVAVVGPSVCGRCYEVPEELVSAAMLTSPMSVTRSWTGTPAIDVAAGVVDQLATEGVAVQWIPGCTREADELYSYRRERQTGRFAGVVMMRSSGGPA